MMDEKLIKKLGLFLTCLFSLFFLALLAEIVYVFLYQRHVIHFLHRFKRQPARRVDSAVAADRMTRAPGNSESTTSVGPEVEDLVKMRAYSRLLFTIEEEDKEGLDYSSERSVEIVREQVKTPSCGDHTTPLETPCDSPVAFFTPYASPRL